MESQVYSGLYDSYQKIYNEGKADKLLTKPIDRSDARTERAGGDEPSRMLKHFTTRNVKKKKGLKEELDIVIEYLLDEGFTDSEEGAEIIVSSMSEQWYENILESLSNLSNMKPSEIKSQRQTLETQWKDLVNQVMQAKDPSEKAKLASKAKSIKSKIDAAKKEEGFHKSLTTKDDDTTGLTPEQIAKKRQVQKATYGSTPQTSKDAVPIRQTAAQRAAEREADKSVGHLSPTYYNRETGRREPIKAVGSTEQNYGGRGSKRVTARYQQGATGSGTQGPTPAGSTIDPTRRRLRGTGRSIG